MFRLLRKMLPLVVMVPGLGAQPVEVARVRAERVARTAPLPAEIRPWQRVAVQARATGFVEAVMVDRGSMVKAGEVLATLSAPELAAATAEAEARRRVAESRRLEAVARRSAARATEERLRQASATPGAIAGNELVQAGEAVAAAQGAVEAAEASIAAAEAAVRAARQGEAYLRVTAPFAGVITERMAHPGALVGPGSAGALFELEEVVRLRVEVAVPEAQVAGIRMGAVVPFTVPAYPGRTFRGTVARVDRSLDPKTRAMAVELDAANRDLALAPGMYAEAAWPAGGAGESLLVPAGAVVTTTERSFVIRVREGRAEWVDVRRGAAAGGDVVITGALRAGDVVVKRATDEIRPGAAVTVR